ncbi:MAG: hypothetical protein AAB785_01050 [Patescibacteria group bacterium]
MAQTSKEMFENVKSQTDKAHENLKKEKDDLENLENQLKVEEKIFIEFQEKKDELAETQKYIVEAVQGEIMTQKNKILELETDIKLLAKKCEVLSRDTWNF